MSDCEDDARQSQSWFAGCGGCIQAARRRRSANVRATRFVQVGKSRCVGQLYGWWPPNCVVWVLTRRTWIIGVARECGESNTTPLLGHPDVPGGHSNSHSRSLSVFATSLHASSSAGHTVFVTLTPSSPAESRPPRHQPGRSSYHPPSPPPRPDPHSPDSPSALLTLALWS